MDYIIAANQAAAERYRREHNLAGALYVSEAVKLKGLRNVRVHFALGWQLHPQADDIRHEVSIRQLECSYE